jgi:GNAT superfamily N-acetyltransferase
VGTITSPDNNGAMSDLDIRAESMDSEAAQTLIGHVQQEYVKRYGGFDETALESAEFAPPNGAFFVGYLDGIAVICGGWRALPSWPRTAEIKRMFVLADYRRLGLARLLLAHIEDSARDAGYDRLWLETGENQPEALALYASSGYEPIEGYGHYKDAPLGRPMGKSLR